MTVLRTDARRLSFLVSAQFAIVLAGAADLYGGEPAVDFNRDIRPILSDKCFHCHGPDASARVSDLRLDLRESATADLGGYRAIVPGRLDESEVISRITSDDEVDRMPPEESGKSMSAEQVKLLRRWVEQGAAWSQHWAYVPPHRLAPPDVEQTVWPLNWIDQFVLARLEAEGLQPSPEADRVTLLRRLSFDLTGLPPSAEEVAEFVADQKPEAYEQVVDRLLDSDHFGERMAMYWLDLVRYADTVGYHGDQDHSISPYRDWVIQAFNNNVPFDEFTRAQLAGDLMPEPTIEQKIATGYNRLLQTSHEGGVQPKEYLAIYAADRVRNLSAVWLGATMGCAQCHDHKYDPFTTKDFYSMVAFFADIDEAEHLTKGTNSLPTARRPEMKVFTPEESQQVADLEKQIRAVEAERTGLSDSDPEKATELKQTINELTKKKAAIEKNARATMITVAIKPRTIRVLPRGNWLDDSGEIVSPAVPAFLRPISVADRPANRRDLADWLTDAGDGIGGLTARVQVNRFWYLLFGHGIAGVLDDFGGQGAPPTHPELLDALGLEFVENGWDVKHLVKLIVMSRTYRQSSLVSPIVLERDPYNRLLSRQSRFRLPAEMIRDSALAISGLLVRDIGGASVKPYQPAGYYRHLNFPKRTYQHHSDDRQWRRGIYVHWQRQFLHPMLLAFDAPLREECAAQRPRSNTPMGALAMLNDPTFVEAARVFAERILRSENPDENARLDYAFRRAVSRAADSYEQQVFSELLDVNRDYYDQHPNEAKKLVGTGESAVADDLDTVELAAWTGIARAILNLNETITRN